MTAIDLGTLSIGIKTDGVSESAKDMDKAKKAFENVQKSVGELDKQMELNQANYEAEISYIKSNTTTLNKNWQESKKVAAQRKYLSDMVKSQTDKVKMLKDGLEKLTNSEEQNTDAIADQKIEIAKAVKQLNEYQTELRESAKEEITHGFEKIKTGIKAVTTAAVAMGTAIVGALITSAEATREYREDQAKLITAFEQGGFSADAAKESYANMYAILGEDDRSVEAANHLAKLCETEEELAAWSEICAGVSATFGDSLPIEGLTEAANETAKVGQVTGPLADALNWAGVSEDAFNESLTACNTEQERSQLITETLLGLYEDAGAQYKEMNKDIIANRDAQRQMQDATAKVGEAIEPVLAQGKQMIAEFLTRLADWVSNNQGKIIGFVGKVKDFVNFLIKHKRAVITMISSVGTAFLAWNVASMISKVVLSIKALTSATKAAAAAQGVLNLTLSANPFGAIAAVIGLVVGGLTAFALTADDAAESTSNLSKEEKELRDSIEQSGQAIEESRKAIDENIDAVLSEMSHTEDLKNELMGLADEKGKVADKDKARAQFILNELNKALGTEYSMTGDVINQYDNLCSSIDEVIEKKKGMMILEGQEEDYKKALEKEGALTQEFVKAESALYDLMEEMRENENELKALYDRLVENGEVQGDSFEKWFETLSKMRGAYGEEGTKLIEEYDRIQAKAQEISKTYTDAAEQKKANDEIIRRYESDSLAIIQGNTSEVISSWEARTLGLKTHTEATETELKKQAETYTTKFQAVLKRIENGDKVSDTYFNSIKDMAKAALKQAELAGIALPEGLKEGIDKEMPKTAEEAKTQSENLLEQMKIAFDINSPSKKTMVMGKYLVEGLWKGIDGDTQWLIGKIKKFCKDSLDAIREYFGIHSPSKKTEEFGQYIVQGLAEGIKEDMSAEEALEQKCKNLTSILKEFTDSFSLDSSIAENEFTLWKLQNPNATPDESAAAEKQMLNKQLKNQADAIDVTNQAFLESKELTGENSEESKKLYEQLIKEKIAYEQLLVSIENVNKERDEAKAKAYEAAYKSNKARSEVLRAQEKGSRELSRLQTESKSQISDSQSRGKTSVTQIFYTKTAKPSEIRNATVKAMTSQEVIAAL